MRGGQFNSPIESLPLQMSVMVKEGGGSPAYFHTPSVAVDQGGRYRHEMLHLLEGRVDVGVHIGGGALLEREGGHWS